MKKIECLLLGCLILTGCNKNDNSSSTSNSSTQDSSKVSSESTNLDSSKKQEYYTTAISNLFLSYEGIDIIVEPTTESSVELEGLESTSHIYYNIIDDVYQIQSNDSYITYMENTLYIDNINHYMFEGVEFDSSYFLILMGTLQSIDVSQFNLTKTNNSILLSYVDENNNTYTIYLEESVLVTLSKIEVVNENIKLSIVPNNELELIDITNNNHLNLKEDLQFLDQYFEYLSKDNLDYAFTMDFNHMDLEVNMSKRANVNEDQTTYVYNGDISYRYLKDELNFVVTNNELYYEEEVIAMEALMELLKEKVNPNSLMDFALYFINLANSELVIEENLITFESDNFIEEITFTMSEEEMIIESLYLDSKLTVKEVIE